MNIFKKSKIANTKGYNLNNNNNFLFGKDETLLPKFTKIFGLNYSVNVYYFKIKSPQLNLNKTQINIHLPMEYRKKNNQSLLDIILLKMYTQIAETEIEDIMEKARHIFGFAPEDYEIKKLSSSLAVCNQGLQTISINPYIVMYSKDIIEYIIFHEFCHLKYKTHSKGFWQMMKTYMPNYEKYEMSI